MVPRDVERNSINLEILLQSTVFVLRSCNHRQRKASVQYEMNLENEYAR